MAFECVLTLVLNYKLHITSYILRKPTVRFTHGLQTQKSHANAYIILLIVYLRPVYLAHLALYCFK